MLSSIQLLISFWVTGPVGTVGPGSSFLLHAPSSIRHARAANNLRKQLVEGITGLFNFYIVVYHHFPANELQGKIQVISDSGGREGQLFSDLFMAAAFIPAPQVYIPA